MISVVREFRKFEEKIVCYVDSNYFKVFSTPLLLGNPELCLTKPHTAVISQKAAKKYFGSSNPLGKTFELKGEEFEVTGVYDNIPANSHFRLDILLSYNTPTWLNTSYSDSWDMLFTNTYLLLDKGVDASIIEKKVTEITNFNKPDNYKDNNWDMRLQNIKDIHLHTNFGGGFEEGGNATMNKVLTIAAFIILLFAWLNYISMTSAQSLDRAKEVGIKKVVGFTRTYLMRGFLIESLVMNLVAVIISFFIVLLVKPSISNLLNINLSFAFLDFGFIVLLFVIFIIGAFLSGIYPAFVLSSFNPVQVLKGKIGISTGKIGFRKILLGFQFGISALLIFTTLIIFLQTNSMLNRNLGIDISNTLVLKGSNLQSNDSIFITKIESFKQALVQNPQVLSASSSNAIPANTGFTDDVCSDIQRPEDGHQFSVSYIDYNYLPSLDNELLAGRLFSKDFPSDNQAAIISESGMYAFGFDKAEDAIDHKTNRAYGDKNKHIIGVIKGYQLNSWKVKAMPMIFYLNPLEKTYLVIKLDRPINNDIIKNVENTWKEFFGDELFRYFELEKSYKELYKNDIRNSKVLIMFAILGIFVACIGLWGLAYFTITSRKKEIGIRKVIGFTAVNIINLINKEFISLVFISSLIATPIAWWLANKWLLNYSTKINIAWWYALLPFVVISLITIITISFYSVKTALINPSETIRDE